MKRLRTAALLAGAGLVSALTAANASLLLHGTAAVVAWVVAGVSVAVALGIALGLAATRNSHDTTTGDPE